MKLSCKSLFLSIFSFFLFNELTFASEHPNSIDNEYEIYFHSGNSRPYLHRDDHLHNLKIKIDDFKKLNEKSSNLIKKTIEQTLALKRTRIGRVLKIKNGASEGHIADAFSDSSYGPWSWNLRYNLFAEPVRPYDKPSFYIRPKEASFLVRLVTLQGNVHLSLRIHSIHPDKRDRYLSKVLFKELKACLNELKSFLRYDL